MERVLSTYFLNYSFTVMGQGQVWKEHEDHLLDCGVLKRHLGSQLQDTQHQGAAGGSSVHSQNGILSRTWPANRTATLKTTTCHNIFCFTVEFRTTSAVKHNLSSDMKLQTAHQHRGWCYPWSASWATVLTKRPRIAIQHLKTLGVALAGVVQR